MGLWGCRFSPPSQHADCLWLRCISVWLLFSPPSQHVALLYVFMRSCLLLSLLLYVFMLSGLLLFFVVVFCCCCMCSCGPACCCFLLLLLSAAVAEDRIKQLVAEVQRGTQGMAKARAAATDAQTTLRQKEGEVAEVCGCTLCCLLRCCLVATTPCSCGLPPSACEAEFTTVLSLGYN